MSTIPKHEMSERDICSKFITPAVKRAGWEEMTQIREEVGFTKGRIIVRGKLVTRGQAKRADYILYYKPNIPIAIIVSRDNHNSVGDVEVHIIAVRVEYLDKNGKLIKDKPARLHRVRPKVALC